MVNPALTMSQKSNKRKCSSLVLYTTRQNRIEFGRKYNDVGVTWRSSDCSTAAPAACGCVGTSSQRRAATGRTARSRGSCTIRTCAAGN